MASTSASKHASSDDASDPVGLSGDLVIKVEPPDDTTESPCCDEGSDKEITYDSSDDESEGDDFGDDVYDDDDGGDYYYFFDDEDEDEDGKDSDDGTEDAVPQKRARLSSPDLQSTSGRPSFRPRVYKAPSGHKWTSQVLKQETLQVKVKNEPPGPKDVDPASTKLELLHLFLPQTMLHKILLHTNEEGRRKRGGSWSNAVMTELMTVLGLLYFLGLTKSSQENAKTFWKDGLFGRPVCQAAMMGKRFQSIMSMLQFEEKARRDQQRGSDKFVAIRDVFKTFATSCQCFFCPGDSITVGEQFLPFRGKCPFKQYAPETIPKCHEGIKFLLSVDSSHHFVTNIQPCLSEQGTQPGSGVVLDLLEPILQTGRNVTASSAFTSRKLAEDLLAENLTLVGAVKTHLREVPKELSTNVKKRDAKSSVFAFDGPLTLLSFIPRKHFQVLLLSTMHHDDSVNSLTQKPKIVDCYNKTKHSMNMVDQMCSLYSVIRLTKRWPVVVFYNLMNLAANNACVLWCALNPDWMPGASTSNRRHAFLGDLVTELVHPQLQARAMNPIGLHRTARLALSSMGYEVQYRHQTLPGERADDKRPIGRCYLCPRRDGKRTTNVCYTCRRYSCGLHSKKTFTVSCDVCLQ